MPTREIILGTIALLGLAMAAYVVFFVPHRPLGSPPAQTVIEKK